MFQNIVNATEPMTDEKESIGYVSNNPIRKEIVMYVSLAVADLLRSRRVSLSCEDSRSHVTPVTGCLPLPPPLSLSVSLAQGHDDDRL